MTENTLSSSTMSALVVENEAFWRQHATLLKASKLTRREYCRLHNVNYDRFGYWLGKLIDEISPLVSVKLKPTNESNIQTILCTLTLGSHRVLQIHDYHALAFILEKVS